MTRRSIKRSLLISLVLTAAGHAEAQRADSLQDSIASRAIRLGAMRVSLAELPDVDGTREDLWRLAQLRGAHTAGLLLRTPSSMTARLGTGASRVPLIPLRWAVVPPQVQYTGNSAVPFSSNDGAMWAGKGSNVAVSAGLRAEWGRFRLGLKPALIHEANRPLPFFDNLHSGLPYLLPAYRSQYSTLWNIFPNGADVPFRFGDASRTYGDPGESFASIDVGRVRAGVSTEHEWWGPGIQNALLLSSNAAGVPRVFVRSGAPLRTRAGSFEFSTFLGKLQESEFYRTPSAAADQGAFQHVGTRSRLVASGAVVWQPNWEPDLSLGVARSVYGERVYRGPLFFRWFDLFRNIGQPDDRPRTDTTAQLGRDQLLSVFGRWVMPNDGFEVYFEWLRASMPVSLRDFLTDPNHSRGYTVGLQWLGSANARGAALRVQAEVTNLEQDASFRFRPLGSIYTSRVVPQGYTQRGQPLGAAIGPGSSGQFLAGDYVTPGWSLGLFGQRIRWNEDAHQLTPYPSFKGWCESDVSVIAGLRGRWTGKTGAVSAALATSRRLNVFFQNFAACPLMSTDPGRVVDLRNVTLRLDVEPLVGRLW